MRSSQATGPAGGGGPWNFALLKNSFPLRREADTNRRMKMSGQGRRVPTGPSERLAHQQGGEGRRGRMGSLSQKKKREPRREKKGTTKKKQKHHNTNEAMVNIQTSHPQKRGNQHKQGKQNPKRRKKKNCLGGSRECLRGWLLQCRRPGRYSRSPHSGGFKGTGSCGFAAIK